MWSKKNKQAARLGAAAEGAGTAGFQRRRNGTASDKRSTGNSNPGRYCDALILGYQAKPGDCFAGTLAGDIFKQTRYGPREAINRR